uniref:Uncharacterized protein n=1 Tax=Arundo donax TaxID=35708 RepID=A0A0A9ELC6_ARUDO
MTSSLLFFETAQREGSNYFFVREES